MKNLRWMAAGALIFGAIGARAEVKPFLSIVPRLCGINTLESVGGPAFVNQVCLSGLAGTSHRILHVTFTDHTEMALPIVASKRERGATIHYAATGEVTRAADGGPVRLGTVAITQRGMGISGRTPRGLSFEATLGPMAVTAGVR